MNPPTHLAGPDDLAELTALLPPPGDPRLGPERRGVLRTHLLTEIRGASPAPRRRMLVAVGAGALGVALAAGVGVRVWTATREIPTEAAPIVQVLRGDPTAAPAFLTRLAAAAALRPPTDGGPGAYLYVKSRTADAHLRDAGPFVLEKVHDREIWIPLSGTGEGRIREGGRTITLAEIRPGEFPARVPDDPDQLLDKIYGNSRGQGNSADGQAFTVVGDLLRESLLPPRSHAVLYRAAAKIPGVELLPDAVDAAGRHGTAVAHTENGVRSEWIFDPGTLEYLGERRYLVEDTSFGKAGMLYGTNAVLSRTIVGNLGDRP